MAAPHTNEVSSSSTRSRSRSRKQSSSSSQQQPQPPKTMQFGSKNEALAILAILENRVRTMRTEQAAMRKLEKKLARVEKSIEDQTEKMREKVRGAEEEMRGRLGLDPELRWSDVRRMKWGADMDEETSLSRTKSSGSSVSAAPDSTSTEASSIEPSSRSTSRRSIHERPSRSEKKKEKTQAATLPPKKNPVAERYDEAIKHLDVVGAQLKAIAVSAIREDDDLHAHGVAVRELAEKLKASRDQAKN